ncbi:MAG: histidine ammonia-lyase [Thermoplasmata archaeon]
MSKVNLSNSQGKIKSECVVIDGEHLTIEDVVKVAREGAKVELSPSAKKKIEKCRRVVDELVAEEKPVYGLTTGFGSKASVFIPKEDAVKLQLNLIRSHSCAVGKPLEEDVVRAIMLLRANTLAKGHSGVRLGVIETILEMLNAGVYPKIPQKGSLGASGDLACLSHMVLVMMGEGEAFDREKREDGKFEYISNPEAYLEKIIPGREALKKAGIKPVVLSSKEGIALNNGSQVMTAIGALLVYDAENLVRNAEIACAMSLEAMNGVAGAFDPRIHALRPHPGQVKSAKNIRALIEGSEILQYPFNVPRVQRAMISIQNAVDALKTKEKETRDAEEAVRLMNEAYAKLEPIVKKSSSLPDTIGSLVEDALSLLVESLEIVMKMSSGLGKVLDKGLDIGLAKTSLLSAIREIQSIEPSKVRKPQDAYSLRCMPQVAGASRDAIEYCRRVITIEINSATDNPLIFPDEKEAISGGNFHGQPIAIAMDLLGIALSEIADISERRIARLVDGALSNGLPSLLVIGSGLNSGFMIPQYTAASLVSENKVLSHPASVDSIPSCENQEDHVSMGTTAARKARDILWNAEYVVAIELLCAAQGLDFRNPLQPGKGTRAAYKELRKVAKHVDEDRILVKDIESIVNLIRMRKLVKEVEKEVGKLE